MVLEVKCFPPSGYDLELYIPEPLFHHRPLEAPVSPRKIHGESEGRKKKVSLSWLSCKSYKRQNKSF